MQSRLLMLLRCHSDPTNTVHQTTQCCKQERFGAYTGEDAQASTPDRAGKFELWRTLGTTAREASCEWVCQFTDLMLSTSGECATAARRLGLDSRRGAAARLLLRRDGQTYLQAVEGEEHQQVVWRHRAAKVEPSVKMQELHHRWDERAQGVLRNPQAQKPKEVGAEGPTEQQALVASHLSCGHGSSHIDATATSVRVSIAQSAARVAPCKNTTPSPRVPGNTRCTQLSKGAEKERPKQRLTAYVLLLDIGRWHEPTAQSTLSSVEVIGACVSGCSQTQ